MTATGKFQFTLYKNHKLNLCWSINNLLNGFYLVQAFPCLLGTTNGSWIRLTAAARLRYYLWAWWTRSRMTKQNTPMTTIGLKFFATHFTTRMWYQPCMTCRIHFFRTEASVGSWNFTVQIVVSTFRTIPLQHFLLFSNIFALIGVIAHFSGLLLTLL